MHLRVVKVCAGIGDLACGAKAAGTCGSAERDPRGNLQRREVEVPQNPGVYAPARRAAQQIADRGIDPLLGSRPSSAPVCFRSMWTSRCRLAPC